MHKRVYIYIYIGGDDMYKLVIYMRKNGYSEEFISEVLGIAIDIVVELKGDK